MNILRFTGKARPRQDRPGGSSGGGRPGSAGEHVLQERYGTRQRAAQFYANQLCEQLTPRMTEFIARMEMAFIATADAGGDCDCSFRAGAAGFLRVLDEHTIAYPEYRGNGVMASLGNIAENPHIGVFMADFTRDLIGLHVNGYAEILSPAEMQALGGGRPEPAAGAGRTPAAWVLVTVTEAYIHCSKHLPKLVPQSRVRHWGTDNPRHKGGDYFGAAAQKVTGTREDLAAERDSVMLRVPGPGNPARAASRPAARGRGHALPGDHHRGRIRRDRHGDRAQAGGHQRLRGRGPGQ